MDTGLTDSLHVLPKYIEMDLRLSVFVKDLQIVGNLQLWLEEEPLQLSML